MDENVPHPEHATAPEAAEAQPVIPTEPVPPIESRFLFVDVAALRAKQLRRGARLRIADDHLPKKPERLAMEEVRRGMVMYDVPQPKPAESSAE